MCFIPLLRSPYYIVFYVPRCLAFCYSTIFPAQVTSSRTPTWTDSSRSGLATHFCSLFRSASASLFGAQRPTIRPPTALLLSPHRPLPHIMTASEAWAVGDAYSDVRSRSTTTAVLKADIETLTAFKDMVEATPVKAVFESVIVILTLVRVRPPVLILCLHSPTCVTTRTS